MFARDRKYNLEETLFDKFDDVSREIERRTEKRVGTLKNVRFETDKERSAKWSDLC